MTQPGFLDVAWEIAQSDAPFKEKVKRAWLAYDVWWASVVARLLWR